jgi:hypothetical protein
MADFTPFVRWFKDIGLADVPQVGGTVVFRSDLTVRCLAAT